LDCDRYATAFEKRRQSRRSPGRSAQFVERVMRILAISGSLRSGSSNTDLLRAIGALAPDDVQIVLYDGLAALPNFNPDLDEVGTPRPVLDFRGQLRSADGVIISSPEYAHGVPGALKNALDWVVGNGELAGKPVALINASPRSTYAYAQLFETLTAMSWKVVKEASITILLSGKKLDAAGIAADPELSTALRGALAAFVRAIRGAGGDRR
jgi:chromate reductase, NAD(P)H dehydrogenase (quinone)